MPTITVYGAGTQQYSGTWYLPERSAGSPDGLYARLISGGSNNALSWTSVIDVGQSVVITGIELTVWYDSPNNRIVRQGVTIGGQYTYDTYVDVPSGFSSQTTSWVLSRSTGSSLTVSLRTSEIDASPSGFGIDAFRAVILYEPLYSYPTVSDSGTITGSDTVSRQTLTNANASDSGSIVGYDSTNYSMWNIVADTADIGGSDTTKSSITAQYIDTSTISSAETVSRVIVTTPAADTGTVAGVDTTRRFLRAGWQSLRLRAVCRDINGAITASLNRVLAAKYRLTLSRIGSWEIVVPAEDAIGLTIASARTVDIVRENEGIVCRGMLDEIDLDIGEAGDVVAKLSGQTLARELVLPSVISYQSAGESLAEIASTLVTPHGWQIGQCPPATLSVSIAGVSPWQAIAQMAERIGAQVCEDPLTRTIDIISDAESSGLHYRTGAPPVDDPLAQVMPVLRAVAVIDGSQLYTRVVPYAETVNGRTARLENSTRTSPYTIQSGTAEDGSTYYYLQDSSSSQYGVRTIVQTWKGIAPLDDTSTEAERAANDLYDAAANWLRTRAQPILRISVEPSPTFHVSAGGVYRLLPGQTIAAQIKASVRSENGPVAVVDVIRDLYVVAIERSFGEAGDDQWRIETADIPVPPQDDIDQLAVALSALQVVQLGVSGGGSTGGSGGGATTRTIWDTVIEGALRGDLGTPWW